MSDLLRELWSRAECEEPVFSAEEIEWAPPGQFELLCSLGLLKETDRATWARCEACGDGHVETLLWVQNATTGRPVPFVPCPENGGVSVPIERLRRWAVDLDAIAQAARHALGLIGNDSVLLPGRVWFLGRRHVAGRFRDFFLVVGAARDDAHTLWDRCRQIEDAPWPIILVPNQAPSERKAPTFRLPDLASITDDRIVVDLDYLADALPRERNATPPKTIASFPVPEDATWPELRIVVREHSLLARLRHQEQEFEFCDLGISGPDDRLWRLISLFARNVGRTPPLPRTASAQQAATFRKQTSDLRHLLQTAFPLPGNPLLSLRGTGGYRCLFQIGMDRRAGFPIHAHRWEDCTFSALGNGEIRVSVSFIETYTVKQNTRGTHSIEVQGAQQESISSEVVTLRSLGLADDAGTASAEGTMLLALLRSGGKLGGRGDDKRMLRLGRKLQEYMGLTSSPFVFVPSRSLWKTIFGCEPPSSGHPSYL